MKSLLFSAVFLSNLIEPCEFDDLDITDFMVKSVSAFEMLFEDESRMNVSTSYSGIIIIAVCIHEIK